MASKMRLIRASGLYIFKQDFMPNHCKDSLSNSFKAMTQHGWITSGYSGGYSIMPQLQRSVDKLSSLISQTLDGLGALRVTLPYLTKSSVLEQTKRWRAFPELFTIRDRRGDEFALNATCEEGMCHMLSTVGRSIPHSRLPIMFYQISTKFRDELHPRNGLLRSREFLMKDLYSFDTGEVRATETYYKVLDAYKVIFDRLGLPYFRVEGSVGIMGGLLSHEFHVLSPAGENEILVCPSCRLGYNTELLKENNYTNAESCSNCGAPLQKENGIEIAHTFLLGTKYSKSFDIVYKDASGNCDPVWMGCFGIGISRLISACIEQLGTEKHIVLPPVISPYLGVVIPQKEGYRFTETLACAERLEESLCQLSNAGDFVFDDRSNLSIGKRIQENRSAGIPLSIVVGKTALENPPKIEIQYKSCHSLKEKEQRFVVQESEVNAVITAVCRDFK